MIETIDPGMKGLAAEGVMGSVQPSREQRADIAFGWPLLLHIVEMGIGSAMVVRERDVIAVEATEGTQALIKRAGTLCRRKGWILLKTFNQAPDPGADVPSIDVKTVRAVAGAGGGCIALGAGRVRLDDEAGILEAASRAKVALVGVREDPRPPGG